MIQTAFSTEMPSSTRSMDGRRHEDRDHAVECEVRAELQRGQHGDERVDDQHDLAHAERDPPRQELRDDVGAAGVAAALEDQPHADARDRAAPERREQQVVGGEVRRERRETSTSTESPTAP